MLLSIIIPIYNREDKIDRCINSLKKIKKKNVEFVLVNDGSTDNTQVICEEYAKKEPRIRVINQENTGVSGARNTGIQNSKGKYITFVDSDDEITFEYNNIIDNLEKNNTYDFYSFDFFVQNQNGRRNEKRNLYVSGVNDRSILFENYLSGNTNALWCNIYRADIIKDNDISFPIEMSMGEDSVFNAKYIKHCQNVYYINKNGYIYYVDDQSSASYARKKNYLQDFVKIYDNYLMIHNLDAELNYPNCTKYHVNNIYGILKRHHKDITKTEKKLFRRSKFCKNLLSSNYKSWKHEAKKYCIWIYLYLL